MQRELDIRCIYTSLPLLSASVEVDEGLGQWSLNSSCHDNIYDIVLLEKPACTVGHTAVWTHGEVNKTQDCSSYVK